MFKRIKGLFTKEEYARIKELEEKVLALELELVELSEMSAEMDMQLTLAQELEELEFASEKCSCGGHIVPMYEEHPNWIKFCKSCDSRTEDTDNSPIQEPA